MAAGIIPYPVKPPITNVPTHPTAITIDTARPFPTRRGMDDDTITLTARNAGETITVTIPADSTLPDAIHAFERFLRGAGYVFDSMARIKLVEPDGTIDGANTEKG